MMIVHSHMTMTFLLPLMSTLLLCMEKPLSPLNSMITLFVVLNWCQWFLLTSVYSPHRRGSALISLRFLTIFAPCAHFIIPNILYQACITGTSQPMDQNFSELFRCCFCLSRWWRRVHNVPFQHATLVLLLGLLGWSNVLGPRLGNILHHFLECCLRLHSVMHSQYTTSVTSLWSSWRCLWKCRFCNIYWPFTSFRAHWKHLFAPALSHIWWWQHCLWCFHVNSCSFPREKKSSWLGSCRFACCCKCWTYSFYTTRQSPSHAHHIVWQWHTDWWCILGQLQQGRGNLQGIHVFPAICFICLSWFQSQWSHSVKGFASACATSHHCWDLFPAKWWSTTSIWHHLWTSWSHILLHLPHNFSWKFLVHWELEKAGWLKCFPDFST